jgi:hypothetical protein
LKSCVGTDIVSVKVWLLRQWRLAQVFFNALIVERDMMNVFACFAFQDLLIPLGFALALGAVIVFVIIKVFRSGGPV